MVHLNTFVKKFGWQRDDVEVISAAGESFAGSHCLIALPLGVLQAPRAKQAALHSFPNYRVRRAMQSRDSRWVRHKINLRFGIAFGKSLSCPQLTERAALGTRLPSLL